MKFILTLIFTSFLSALPFYASAQQSGLYAVVEGGTVKNSMALSGSLSGLANENNSGTSVGVALGYRTFLDGNIVAGLEGNIASSSGRSNVTDGFDTITFDENLLAGFYLTAGFALNDDRKALIYGLIGIGSVNADISAAGQFTGNQSISDKGNGFSFGGAFEYGFSDKIAVRVKALHTRYKGDVDELKIRDTSIMGGLVYNF